MPNGLKRCSSEGLFSSARGDGAGKASSEGWTCSVSMATYSSVSQKDISRS